MDGMSKQIEVRAAKTQQDVLDHQCDVVIECDTIAEAKRKAKYLLTDECQAMYEASEPNRYAQVVVDGECLYDYFRSEPKTLAQLAKEDKL
jgi:hypothetical protein